MVQEISGSICNKKSTKIVRTASNSYSKRVLGIIRMKVRFIVIQKLRQV